MATVTLPSLQELLEAGVHFGHRRERSHPKARTFTFTIRDGVLIINLEQTIQALAKAIDYLKTNLDSGKKILLVGTKRQYQDLVEQMAQSLKWPYVTNKWLGGTLTNFDQIKKTAKKLTELESLLSPSNPSRPSSPPLTKKERLLIERQIAELHQKYDGIVGLDRLPDLLFVVDPHHEETAVKEGQSLAIPIVAILDTTSNPELIDVPIPANDDSRKSVELILKTIVNGVTGKSEKQKDRETKKLKNEKSEITSEKTPMAKKTPKSKGGKSKTKSKKSQLT